MPDKIEQLQIDDKCVYCGESAIEHYCERCETGVCSVCLRANNDKCPNCGTEIERRM